MVFTDKGIKSVMLLAENLGEAYFSQINSYYFCNKKNPQYKDWRDDYVVKSTVALPENLGLGSHHPHLVANTFL